MRRYHLSRRRRSLFSFFFLFFRAGLVLEEEAILFPSSPEILDVFFFPG